MNLHLLLKRIALLSLLVLLNGKFLQADSISLVADPYLPYTGSPDSDSPGFMIEIAKAIFEKAGHTISYKQQAWVDAVSDVKNGNATAIVGASREDVPELLFPDVEQAMAQGVFYVKAGSSWKYAGVASLEKICIGVISKYSYSEIQSHIEKYRSNSKKVRFFSNEDALVKLTDALRDDRIQAFMEDENVMKSFLKTYPEASQITDSGKLKSPTRLYIAFSPKATDSPTYVKLISDGMKALRADGTLTKILKKYELQDW